MVMEHQIYNYMLMVNTSPMPIHQPCIPQPIYMRPEDLSSQRFLPVIEPVRIFEPVIKQFEIKSEPLCVIDPVEPFRKKFRQEDPCFMSLPEPVVGFSVKDVMRQMREEKERDEEKMQRSMDLISERTSTFGSAKPWRIGSSEEDQLPILTGRRKRFSWENDE